MKLFTKYSALIRLSYQVHVKVCYPIPLMAPLHQRKTMKTSLRPEKIEERGANVVKLK